MKTCPGCEAAVAAEQKACPQCGVEMATEATDWSSPGFWRSGAWKWELYRYALIMAILVIVALKVLQPAIPAQPCTIVTASGTWHMDCLAVPRFGAIARIDLTYTPPYGGGQNVTITRHITDATTIHRFVTAFERLHILASVGCLPNEGREDAMGSFVPAPVHDWWSRLTGAGGGVHTQTFHVIYGCGRIWTGPYEYLDTAGIDTMVRQAAMSH